jgi:release factor glutamine methyltransferase
MNVHELLLSGQRQLMSISPDFARQECMVLLSYVTGEKKEEWFLHPEREIEPGQKKQFDHAIARRVQGEPLAYIVGHKEFFGLDLFVTPHVLIPRPETEILVEEVLRIAQHLDLSHTIFIDIGTGSGAIALAVASALPGGSVLGVDVSLDALSIARENAKKYQLYHVQFLESHLLKQIKTIQESTMVCMVNLPYLSYDDLEQLSLEVKGFEPAGALLGGYNGIELYEELFREIAQRFMDKERYIVFECDPAQIKKIKELARFIFFQPTIRIYKDLSGHERGGVIHVSPAKQTI